jgi:uncharacterized protein DUF4328
MEQELSSRTDVGRATPEPVIWALVLIGAIAPPVAVSYGFWLVHRTAARLAEGPSAGAYETSMTPIATIAGTVGAALAVQAAVGLAFLAWLYRARTNSETLSRGRHRYGRGWTVGAWFVPFANLVLPWVVVTDVLRASRPDDEPTTWPPGTWWTATLLARVIHTAAWVTLVVTIAGTASPAGLLAAAVIHSVGTLCSVGAGLLLGAIVLDISEGQRRLAADSAYAADDAVTVDGEPSCSPSAPASPQLEPGGLGSWFGRGFSSILRSAAPLLLLATVASAVEAVDLVTQLPSVDSSETGVWFGSTGFGIGPARHLLIGGADWISQLTALVALVVRAITYSAALVVVVRLASRDVASVLVGLRVAVRRIHALLGWSVVAVAMAMVGLLLLVVPGVYILIVFTMTLIAVVTLEKRGIRRCFELVRGRFWSTAVRFVVMSLLSQTWWFIAYAIAFQVVDQPLVSVLLYTILGTPAFVFVIGSLSTTYTELRFHEDRRAESSRDPAGQSIPSLRTSTGAANSNPAVRPAEAQDQAATPTDPGTEHPQDIVETDAADVPTALDGRARSSPMRFALIAGGVVLLPAVLLVLAGGSVVHMFAGAPPPDWLPGPRPPAADAGGPPVTPAAADVLAAMLAQSRRDGTGTFSVDAGGGMTVKSDGEFVYRGDKVSVHAEHDDFYITESAAADGRRWVESESPVSGDEIWEECRPNNSEFCEYAGYMQDFADPVQLMSRAGDAVRLTASAPQVADGMPVTRYEFELDVNLAMYNERDPFWRDRFDNTWLQVGGINIWVDSQHRLLQMSVGHLTGEHCTITYGNWGAPQSIAPPATSG